MQFLQSIQPGSGICSSTSMLQPVWGSTSPNWSQSQLLWPSRSHVSFLFCLFFVWSCVYFLLFFVFLLFLCRLSSGMCNIRQLMSVSLNQSPLLSVTVSVDLAKVSEDLYFYWVDSDSRCDNGSVVPSPFWCPHKQTYLHWNKGYHWITPTSALILSLLILKVVLHRWI